jgi:hypothetical protein
MRMGARMKRNILQTAALFTIATSTLGQTTPAAAPDKSMTYGMHADTIGETTRDYAVHNGLKAKKKRGPSRNRHYVRPISFVCAQYGVDDNGSIN